MRIKSAVSIEVQKFIKNQYGTYNCSDSEIFPAVLENDGTPDLQAKAAELERKIPIPNGYLRVQRGSIMPVISVPLHHTLGELILSYRIRIRDGKLVTYRAGRFGFDS